MPIEADFDHSYYYSSDYRHQVALMLIMLMVFELLHNAEKRSNGVEAVEALWKIFVKPKKLLLWQIML